MQISYLILTMDPILNKISLYYEKNTSFRRRWFYWRPLS
jgi:hypothetical protein